MAANDSIERQYSQRQPVLREITLGLDLFQRIKYILLHMGQLKAQRVSSAAKQSCSHAGESRM